MNLVLKETDSSVHGTKKVYTGFGYRITVTDCSRLASSPLLATGCRIEPLYEDIDGQAAMYPNVRFAHGKCYADFRNGMELDSSNAELWYRGIHNATLLMREIEDNKEEIFSFS